MARADALVEDMRRRQAAQEKRDRENPPPPPPTLPTFQPAPQPAAQPIAAPTYAPPPSAPIAAPAAPADARGEQWWKEQARTLQDRVEDETRKMNAARAAMLNSTLRITADEAEREYLALVASVRNAQAALDRHRDDARRAGVPAGWARWP